MRCWQRLCLTCPALGVHCVFFVSLGAENTSVISLSEPTLSPADGLGQVRQAGGRAARCSRAGTLLSRSAPLQMAAPVTAPGERWRVVLNTEILGDPLCPGSASWRARGFPERLGPKGSLAEHKHRLRLGRDPGRTPAPYPTLNQRLHFGACLATHPFPPLLNNYSSSISHELSQKARGPAHV